MKGFNQKWKDFHEGKLSRSHAKAFLEYLNSPDGKEDFQQLLKSVWESETRSDSAMDTSPTKQIPQKGDNEQKKTSEQNRIPSWKFPQIYTLVRYAASFLLLIFMLRELGLLKRSTADQKEIHTLAEATWITKSNPKGIKSKILLPDSSQVFLNTVSEIKYPRNFNENRRVIVDGEAFFEVKRKMGMPFTVQAAHVTATVLGTSFNVNTQSPQSTEITLATGEISIRNDQSGKELLLSPGEGSVVSTGNEPMQKFDIELNKISLWREGILHFDKEPFQEILIKLENWYDVEISVNGHFPEEKCSGTFEKNAYLSDVLNVLGHSMKFDYELNGKAVSIYPSPG